MIKIIDSANLTLAILKNVVSPIITEEINREFTFTFSTVIDNNKSNYVNYQNKVEVEDNYFNIVYTEDERTQDGIFIHAQCEHVSYDLLSANFTAGFTATGKFSSVATTILSGTGFSVGTVASTSSQTISVLQSTNARSLLLDWASLHSGEIQWSKYSVNQVAQRGANRGARFQYRKNIIGTKRITDNRKKVGGLPTISYQVSPAELEFEQGFIDAGIEASEHYELGDTIHVIDNDLGIDTSLRIVKESHDTEQRMQGQVEISNFVENLSDTLTQIQTTSVSKDNVYNGCSIGPTDGFVAERSDSLVKTFMNATNGIEIDLRASTTASYTPVFYVTVNTSSGTANLFLAGDAILTGQIAIGSGNNIFKANGTDGIWLGNATFASAPFRCTMSGILTATQIVARDRMKISSNIFETDTLYGMQFGEVTTGYEDPVTLTYFQGFTTATDTQFEIIAPTNCRMLIDAGIIDFGGAVEVHGTTKLFGTLDVSGNITLNGSLDDSTGAFLSISSNNLTYTSQTGSVTFIV